MDVKFIMAIDGSGGIGKDGKLPWPYLKNDMKNFSQITIGNKKNAVIMGRKTYESIPEHNRPLKNRMNIILTRKYKDYKTDESTIFLGSVEDVFNFLKNKSFDDIFVIGGAEIYKLFYDYCSDLLLTKIDDVFDCDTFFHIDLGLYGKYADIGVVINDEKTRYRYIHYNIKKIKRFRNVIDKKF